MSSYVSGMGSGAYSPERGKLPDLDLLVSQIGNWANGLSGKFKFLKNKFRRQPSIDSIEGALAEANLGGVSALILYEPKVHSAGFLSSSITKEYHFIAIARTSQEAQLAINKIYEMGYGGGGSIGISYYNGSNGLCGDRHHVIGDFTKLVRNNPRQGEILFMPVKGLVTWAVSTDYSRSRYMEIKPGTIQRCVEATPLR